MKAIRDAQTIIASLEDGKCIQALSSELVKTLAALNELSSSHNANKVKGYVNLKLNIAISDGTAVIAADITSKCPKEPRGNSLFWVLDDGALTTEHPQQTKMSFSPRAVTSYEVNNA